MYMYMNTYMLAYAQTYWMRQYTNIFAVAYRFDGKDFFLTS